MKVTAAFCMSFLLIGATPLLASSQNAAPGTGGGSSAVTVPAQWRVAQSDTTTTTTSQTSTSSTSTHKRHQKERKTASHHPRSGAAIYKEGGKTCSGLDEYKVCW